MSYIYEIKQVSELFDDLKRMGRDNFSYDGAAALMEYLESIAEDTGEPMEYDPIAYCCDFAEYADSELSALSDEYTGAPKVSDYDDSEEWREQFIEWLEENTTVIKFDDGIIIQGF